MLKIHILTNLEKWTNMQNFFNVYGGPLKKLRSVVHGLKKNSDGRLSNYSSIRDKKLEFMAH